MDQTTEDLRAFERRLTEVVNRIQPSMWRYRALLITIICVLICSAWIWLSDPQTAKLTFYDSLWEHKSFTLSCISLVLLFFFGIHSKIVASTIVTARCRSVLSEYNMSCDDSGRLILKPRPNQ